MPATGFAFSANSRRRRDAEPRRAPTLVAQAARRTGAVPACLTRPAAQLERRVSAGVAAANVAVIDDQLITKHRFRRNKSSGDPSAVSEPSSLGDLLMSPSSQGAHQSGAPTKAPWVTAVRQVKARCRRPSAYFFDVCRRQVTPRLERQNQLHRRALAGTPKNPTGGRRIFSASRRRLRSPAAVAADSALPSADPARPSVCPLIDWRKVPPPSAKGIAPCPRLGRRQASRRLYVPVSFDRQLSHLPLLQAVFRICRGAAKSSPVVQPSRPLPEVPGR